MAKPSSTLRNVLIWTYDRGTLQYDIICALILAFIFFVPRGWLTAPRADASAHINRMQTDQKAPVGRQTPKDTWTEKNFE